MTDQPDDVVKPDEASGDPAPETDLAADPEVAVEPGLVVEDDVEFDLGAREAVPSVAARAGSSTLSSSTKPTSSSAMMTARPARWLCAVAVTKPNSAGPMKVTARPVSA